MTTKRASQPAPDLTPVEVNILTGADEQAQDHKAAVVKAAERAAQAMGYDMTGRAREHLTGALTALDALEARLTELREKR